MITILPLLVTALLGIQDPEQDPTTPKTPPPDAAILIDRLARLDPNRRSTVVRNMERRLQRLDDYVLQGVLRFERGLTSYDPPPQPAWLQPHEFAPGATVRRLIDKGSPAHTRVTRQMQPMEFLPDMHAAVVYDWRQGKVVKTGITLDDSQRFANYVHGYPPGADHAVAALLAALDQDPDQRLLGWYFEHLYADRNGGVYESVTMFDAWHSGQVVEMPDTDAVAYARKILDTESFVAPLPSDRRRERLYRRVKEGFASHREYRSLRLCAAATFFAAEPRLDATYAPLVRRCHFMWLQCDNDPEKLAARLGHAADRSEFLREVDSQIRSSTEVVQGRQQALREVADYLRALAVHELEAVNG
ncbi:MAG: hypothetical protein KDC98_20935 [Planctomycetes bacterium]|nr:hypothetical protein [Planctomycetota bacterium]